MASAGMKPPTEAEEHLDKAFASLSLETPVDQIRLCHHFERRLESHRLLIAAKLGEGCPRKTAEAMSNGGGSKRSQKRDSERAETVANNPGLAEQVEAGNVDAETVDHLATAANDEGVIPEQLIDDVAGLDPDQAGRVVKHHLADQADGEELERKRQRQRKHRRVKRVTTTAQDMTPMAALVLEGPDGQIDELFQAIRAAANAAYEAAGGRDIPLDQHVPWNHRLFDATVALLTGTATGTGGGRPTTILTVDITTTGVGRCERVGDGPMSPQEAAEKVANSDLGVIIKGLDAQPLWLGRARRDATINQFLALVVRDRGCVLCGAGFQQCQAHHITPWNAPAQGPTDLDNLALLCQTCHTNLHRRKHTLYRQPHQEPPDQHRRPAPTTTTWATRPATPDETPPPRPPSKRPPQRRRPPRTTPGGR